MPTPLITPTLEAAVVSALEKSGVIPPQEEVVEALKSAGLDVTRLAQELANLIYNSKDAVKRQSIMDALALYGIQVNKPQEQGKSINIQFNIVSENTNLNNLFAPDRS